MSTNITEWIYIHNQNNTARFVLGEKGDHMIACLGINPSTAVPNELDNTLKSVKRITDSNGNKGWVMYNVYPQRATNPKNLSDIVDTELHSLNCDIIKRTVKELGITTIWIACGEVIETRQYLGQCLTDIYQKLSPLNLQWKIVNTLTQSGHPRHPLYVKTTSSLSDFDIAIYCKNL
ncbi:DUF1643 domain-containing protein [Aquimarina sp. 2304DJ70-9]|uniref:DUF1643 domain-containing protein n=1 Tax=Aquimarina penaris TaxID=3231044 RepID=UPI0034629FF5